MICYIIYYFEGSKKVCEGISEPKRTDWLALFHVACMHVFATAPLMDFSEPYPCSMVRLPFCWRKSLSLS